jgi:hypothetical protein
MVTFDVKGTAALKFRIFGRDIGTIKKSINEVFAFDEKFSFKRSIFSYRGFDILMSVDKNVASVGIYFQFFQLFEQKWSFKDILADGKWRIRINNVRGLTVDTTIGVAVDDTLAIE